MSTATGPLNKPLVMIPTRDRPGGLAGAIRSALDTSDADVAVYVDSDQKSMYQGLKESARVMVFCAERVGPVAAVNHMARMANGYAVYGMITDDCEITTPGWDRWLMGAVQYFPGRICVVSPHHNHGNHVDMPFVTREWIGAVGWFAYPKTHHYAWPIITGLIGEMTALVHAPKGAFSINHDYHHGTAMELRHRDALAFFDYVSTDMMATVDKVRAEMAK